MTFYNSISQSSTIPAPIGGWNTRDPLDNMDPADAVELVNWYPGLSTLTIRNGSTVHAASGSSSAIETLAEYIGADGTRKLVGCFGGNIYDFSTSSPSSLGSGFTSGQWQTILFRATTNTRLLFFNGVDQPQQYDGTTLSAANYTTIADDSVLISGVAFKQRLYLVQKNSTSIWYGGVAAITGAVTEYNVGAFLQKGGYIKAITTWTRDSGGGAQDLLCIITNMGEMLVYQGDNPGSAATWGLVGRFYLPPPIGLRCVQQFGADTIILTERGLYALSEVMQFGNVVNTKARITNKIESAFLEAAAAYKNNDGWQLLVYPKGGYILVNVPIASNVSVMQFIMNVTTGAWTKFTGQNAGCWSLFNDDIYFSYLASAVPQSFVIKADTGEADLVDSSGADYIATKIKQAYNYYDDRAYLKRFLMIRPLITATGSLSLSVGIDVDFSNQAVVDSINVLGSAGALWDVAVWDAAYWGDTTVYVSSPYAISGIGRAGALIICANVKYVSANLSASQIIYETGGMI